MVEKIPGKGISNPKQTMSRVYSKPIHRKKHVPETSDVFTAKIKITDQSIAQRSSRRWKGAEYFRRKDCDLTAPAESIVRMNVRVDCDARNEVANISTRENEFNPLLVASGMPNARVSYPVLVVEEEGVKSPALLDTGAGSSYASAAMCNRIPPRARKRTK